MPALKLSVTLKPSAVTAHKVPLPVTGTQNPLLLTTSNYCYHIIITTTTTTTTFLGAWHFHPWKGLVWRLLLKDIFWIIHGWTT